MNSSIEIGDIALYVISGFIALFFIYCIIYRRKIFGETGTVKYEYGYPDFEGSKEGIIEIKDNKIIFKEFVGDKVFFSIPLVQITNVTTDYKFMGSLTYWRIGSYGLFGERNYLFITFRQEGKEYTVVFSTHRHSFVNEKLKQEILDAKDKLLLSNKNK